MALHMTQVEGSFPAENRVSTVIALLPMAVQSRIGPLRHIRRSISVGNIKTTSLNGDGTMPPPRPRSEDCMAPPVTSEPVSLSADLTVRRGMRVSRSDEQVPVLSDRPNTREKYARQGAQLVGMSLAGNDVPSHARARDFERDAYIDGLSYLLRGLPEDLSHQERDRLSRSMPINLQIAEPTQANGDLQSRPQPSSLYRLTSAAVVNLIIVFSLLLPYLLLLLQWLASLERRFQVSETVGQYAILAVNAVGSHSVRVLQVAKGQDGRRRQLVLSRLLWTVKEISRGVSDGVDRGLTGARPFR